LVEREGVWYLILQYGRQLDLGTRNVGSRYRKRYDFEGIQIFNLLDLNFLEKESGSEL